jgi:hypothetical protein
MLFIYRSLGGSQSLLSRRHEAMDGNEMLKRTGFCWFATSIAVVLVAFVWNAQSQIKSGAPQFLVSDRCASCHNKLTTHSGEDFSHVPSWRPTMMANAARDPYWQASVRREVLEHPEAQATIEDECSICHMPMARFESKQAGRSGALFSHLGFLPDNRDDALAADGVSCLLCHQIDKDKLGTRESFNGQFTISGSNAQGERPAYGPYAPDAGQSKVMLMSTGGFRPIESAHLGESEACAVCHTLITKSLGADGRGIGELPEQVPYLEWLHSDYHEKRSCQSCHMPKIFEDTAISSILGAPRRGASRHSFPGGNFFMTEILNRNREELKVQSSQEELAGAFGKIKSYLQSQAARVSIGAVEVRGGRLEADVTLSNLGGHKLPTAYPSRRVWVHLTVKDGKNQKVFESGAMSVGGAIAGNDNDADAERFEPHYTEIRNPGQVQIYESILADSGGVVTTGLLKAVRYIKDNRLLPQGFDKKTAEKHIAVAGNALEDADFIGGSDHVRYSIDLGKAQGPFRIDAELCFQPIGYRWAINLKSYKEEEPRKFTRQFEEAAASSMEVLARASK